MNGRPTTIRFGCWANEGRAEVTKAAVELLQVTGLRGAAAWRPVEVPAAVAVGVR
ncbi:hypothetical protein [Amycolatopsis rifamycinica]|uniref:hypothetical protein n=1 Tax=Amycolatopsis rifamycinica TaxID=287986 RepID=UPI000B219823|nr:hypothetical protein [Amycolatopsis rifamycinica]